MSLTADLPKFNTGSPVRRSLIIRAYFVAAWMSYVIGLYPFRYIIKWFHFTEGSRNFTDMSPDKLQWIDDIGVVVESAAVRLRLRSKIGDLQGAYLAQSLTAMVLLRNKQIPCNLILGIAKDKTTHAWVQCGDIIVIGHKGMERYTPVASFTW